MARDESGGARGSHDTCKNDVSGTMIDVVSV